MSVRGNSLHLFLHPCVSYVYLTFFNEFRIHYISWEDCLQPLIINATRDLDDQHNVAKQMVTRENNKHAK